MKTLSDDQVKRAVMAMIGWHVRMITTSETQIMLRQIIEEPQEESPIPYRQTKAAYSKSEHAHFVFSSPELDRSYDEVEEVVMVLASAFGEVPNATTRTRWRDVARKAIQWKNAAVHDAIERGVYDTLVRDARECEEVVDPMADTDTATTVVEVPQCADDAIRMCGADRPSVDVDDECSHGGES